MIASRHAKRKATIDWSITYGNRPAQLATAHALCYYIGALKIYQAKV